MLKIKSIIALSVLSANAMAFHGNNFTIVSEKITKSNVIDAGIESIDRPAYKTAKAHSVAKDAQGKPMEYIKIDGEHHINLSNNGEYVSHYKYKYILSCDTANLKVERNVDVHAKGNFVDDSHSFITVQKEKEGGCRIDVETTIWNAEGDRHVAYAQLRVRK